MREVLEVYVWKGTIFQVKWLGWTPEDSWDVLSRAPGGREFGAHVPMIEHTHTVGDEIEVWLPRRMPNTFAVRLNGGPLIRAPLYADFDYVIVPDPDQ